MLPLSYVCIGAMDRVVVTSVFRLNSPRRFGFFLYSIFTVRGEKKRCFHLAFRTSSRSSACVYHDNCVIFKYFPDFLAFLLSAAQLHCPERYKSMLKWLDLSRNTLARIRPKLARLFYFTGNKKTLPSCPVAMEMRFNPLISIQGYSSSTSACKAPGKYKVPFFVDRMGPKFFEFTVNAHEASPGHHTQSQGYKENFQ